MNWVGSLSDLKSKAAELSSKAATNIRERTNELKEKANELKEKAKSGESLFGERGPELTDSTGSSESAGDAASGGQIPPQGTASSASVLNASGATGTAGAAAGAAPQNATPQRVPLNQQTREQLLESAVRYGQNWKQAMLAKQEIETELAAFKEELEQAREERAGLLSTLATIQAEKRAQPVRLLTAAHSCRPERFFSCSFNKL